MKLSDNARRTIETFAKEAALRHFQRVHPSASEQEAWRYALRAWRSPEFVQAAAEILAINRAIDEAAAATLN